jgi:ABC-type multidrug transport system fused ATPase/permease subunit
MSQSRPPSDLAATGHPAFRPVRDGLVPFSRRHRRPLAQGVLFSAVLVGARLALPVPLTRVVDQATASPAASSPSGPIALLSAAFVGLALVAGVAEHYERLAFAHFAGRTVSDARSAALAAVSDDDGSASADLTAQVLGDCTRVKAGLKGVLNHITVSGLLMVGVCVALMVTDATVGLTVAAGVLVLAVVAAGGAVRVGAIAAEHRRHEVALAAAVHRLVVQERGADNRQDLESLRTLDSVSGDADVGMTQWEGLTTWIGHIVLLVASAIALLTAVHATQGGTLTTGTLFAVMAYLLVLHGPAIRFTRQVTRIAPLLVSARELGKVLETPA